MLSQSPLIEINPTRLTFTIYRFSATFQSFERNVYKILLTESRKTFHFLNWVNWKSTNKCGVAIRFSKNDTMNLDLGKIEINDFEADD